VIPLEFDELDEWRAAAILLADRLQRELKSVFYAGVAVGCLITLVVGVLLRLMVPTL
jgi:hypothetical protein